MQGLHAPPDYGRRLNVRFPVPIAEARDLFYHLIQTGEPYRLSLPLTVEVDHGAAVRQRLVVEGASTSFRLICPRAPQRLRLDPEGSVLMASSGDATTGDPFVYLF